MVEHLGRVAGAVLGKVEAGAEAGAVAEDHQRAGLPLGAARGRFELGQQRVVDGVALSRTVQADPGDAVAEFIGDGVPDFHVAPPPSPNGLAPSMYGSGRLPA